MLESGRHIYSNNNNNNDRRGTHNNNIFVVIVLLVNVYDLISPGNDLNERE